MAQDLNQILDWLTLAQYQKYLLPIKILFILFSIFLLVSIFYFMIYTDYLYYLWFVDLDEYLKWKAKKKKSSQPSQKKSQSVIKHLIFKLKTRRTKLSPLDKIDQKVKRGEELGLKLALIDIDRLLEKKLEQRKILGKDFFAKIDNCKSLNQEEKERIKRVKNYLIQILKDELKPKTQDLEKMVEVYRDVLKKL